MKIRCFPNGDTICRTFSHPHSRTAKRDGVYNRPTVLLTIVGAVIGAVLSILTTIAVENFRRPRLDLTIESPPCDSDYRSQGRPAQQMRAVRLELHNRALPRWMRWMTRSAALQCLGTITFHHLDAQNVFGRSMAVRWAGSPEPVPIPVIGPGGQQFHMIDFARLTHESRIDVYPGEKELLDVASRWTATATATDGATRPISAIPCGAIQTGGCLADATS